jgi:hypothetical protein
MYTFSKSPAGISIVITDHEISKTAGGAAAVTWKDACDEMKGISNACPFQMNGSDQLIVLNNKAIELMTPEMVLAIVLHEEGHIVLDHLNHPDGIALRAEGKVPSLPWMELEADQYAAQRVGKANVLAALKSMVNEFMFSKTYLRAVGITGSLPTEVRAIMQAQYIAIMQYRYDALK